MNYAKFFLLVASSLLAQPTSGAEIGPADDIESAVAALNPGDELILQGGTYAITWRFSIGVQGTAAQPILIRAKTGETPVTEFLKGRLRSALRVLDGHLRDRDFVATDRPTIADLSLVGYLFWPDEFDVTWDHYPAIEAWLKRIEALPGWVHPYELVPGHPLPDAD